MGIQFRTSTASGDGQLPDIEPDERVDLFYNLVDGERVQSIRNMAVIDPSTEMELAAVPDVDRAVLDQAALAARRAFPAWRDTPWKNRRDAIKEMLDRFKLHESELAALLAAEGGRAVPTAEWELRWVTDLYGPALLGMTLSDRRWQQDGVGNVTQRHVPLGVVGAISPWNLPVLLAFTKVLPALLAGNTVVLKPSPYTPLTVLRMIDHVRDLFPAGVLNVISGGNDLGPLMTSHPQFDKIAFTGSTATGRRVLVSAAETLKRTTLELGGNDAGIVLPDADVSAIAEPIFWSMFLLNGQACVGLKRLYVSETIYDELAAALVAIAARQRLGSALDPEATWGPVQNRDQLDHLNATWSEIQADGAPLLFRGEAPESEGGYFFPITLLDNPSNHAAYVQQENFGPLRSVMKYSSLDDAVRAANDTTYGLGGSVWGSDPVTLESVARRIEAGTVWINQHLNLNPEMPFTGHKSSGIGVEFGQEGLQAYTNLQIIAAAS